MEILPSYKSGCFGWVVESSIFECGVGACVGQIMQWHIKSGKRLGLWLQRVGLFHLQLFLRAEFDQNLKNPGLPVLKEDWQLSDILATTIIFSLEKPWNKNKQHIQVH